MQVFNQVLRTAFVFFLSSSFLTTEVVPTTTSISLDKVEITKPTTHPLSYFGLKSFLDKLAHIESRGKAFIVSKTGYLGKYQFSMKTIQGLGFNVTKEDFLQNERLQDSVVIAYLHHNKGVLSKYIKEYDGQVVDSVYVTKAGILAAAHLCGPGGVISFLTQDNQFATSDGNGVTVKKYLQTFSQYRLKGI